MAGRALSVATQALQATLTGGLPWNEELIDRTTLGSFYVRVGVAIGTADTVIPIQLTRVPSGYIVVRSSNGATVYDGSNPAAWTGAQMTLRASFATTVSLLIA